MKILQIIGKINKKHLLIYGFFCFLYFSSIFVLLFKLPTYPHGLYNWENYSIWRIYQRQYGELQQPFNNYLPLTDGLMTDSGLSPFIGLPVGFIFDNSGVNLFTLRVWSAYMGVFTLLLFFLLTKQFFGGKIAAFSSLFLLCAPSFLVYMRTATNVGISLFFSLITMYLLYRILEKPRNFMNYVLLILSLAINSYLYAPIRFFLLLATVLFLWRIISASKHIVKQKIQRVVFGIGLLFLGYVVFTNLPVIIDTSVNYFHGRGEQIFTRYAESEALQHQGIISLLPIIQKNATDLGKLYLDIDTGPATIDFWNPRGQIISIYLVPFFLFGLFLAFRRLNNPRYLLLLLWFGTTTLPIIFTNNVHIGRLFFSLPPLFIFVGIGTSQLVNYAKHVPYKKLHYPILGGLLFIGLFFEVTPYFSNNPNIDNYISTDLLQSYGMGDSDLYLFNVDAESLRFWTAYFYLHGNYVFVDLNNTQRILNPDKHATHTIYFIEHQANEQTILEYCNQNPYPVLLSGSADPRLLALPCSNHIIQI